DRLGQTVPAVTLGKIDGDLFGDAAGCTDRGPCLVIALGIDVGQHRLGAFSRQRLGNGTADVRGGACYECALTLEEIERLHASALDVRPGSTCASGCRCQAVSVAGYDRERILNMVRGGATALFLAAKLREI